MKKIIIISGIVLGVCFVTLVCVFGIPALIKYNKNLNSNIVAGSETTSDEKDDTGEDVKDEIEFTPLESYELLVGETVNLKSCFTSTNLKAFDILITSESEFLVVSGLEFSVSNDCEIEVKVLSRLKTETEFKELGSFEVVAYQKFDTSKFNYKAKFTSINECDLTITFNEGIDLNLINLGFSSLSLIERQDKENSIILKLAIDNALCGYVNFSYELNTNAEIDKFSKNIELKQDLSYFRLFNKSTLSENFESIDLFLTRNEENYGSIFAYNDIIVANDLVIDNVSYTFEVSNNCVQISKLDDMYRITAKNAGKAIVSVKYGNEVLNTLEVNVDKIEIESVEKRGETFSVYEGESVDISPLEILPNYAPYAIVYKCANENASISLSGIFVSNVVDVYSVEICINELSYCVIVNVVKKVTEKYFDLCNSAGEKLSALTKYKCNANDSEIFTLSFENGDEKIWDGAITDLVVEINGEINNDVIQIDCIDTETLIITFKKTGNYELILRIKDTIFRTRPIILEIN